MDQIYCEYLTEEGNCVQEVEGRKVMLGICPFSDDGLAQIRDCAMSVAFVEPKLSYMQRVAKWEDVKKKGERLKSNVTITLNNGKGVYADVVGDHGTYSVILAKRNWENKNVGGWIQSWMCNCGWGAFSSGGTALGPATTGRWRYRYCSHAYAAMLYADTRARKWFTGDRLGATVMLDNCTKCGGLKSCRSVSGETMCDECFESEMLDSIIAIKTGNDHTGEAKKFLLAHLRKNDLGAALASVDVRKLDQRTSMVTYGDQKRLISTTKKTAGSHSKTGSRSFTFKEQEELQNESLGSLARNNDGIDTGEDYSSLFM